MIVMSFSNAGNFISLQNPQKPDLKTRWVSFVSKWWDWRTLLCYSTWWSFSHYFVTQLGDLFHITLLLNLDIFFLHAVCFCSISPFFFLGHLCHMRCVFLVHSIFFSCEHFVFTCLFWVHSFFWWDWWTFVFTCYVCFGSIVFHISVELDSIVFHISVELDSIVFHISCYLT